MTNGQAWQFFNKSEFDCRCGCGGNEVAHDFISTLDAIRAELGFALVVTSGYRCPGYNLLVSNTGNDGPHTTGRAVDFGISGERALHLVAVAEAYGMTGIGLNQKGKHSKRFIHLDNLEPPNHPRPNVWTY